MIDFTVSKDLQKQLKTLAQALREELSPVAEDLEAGRSTAAKALGALKTHGLLSENPLPEAGLSPALSQTFTDALVTAVSPALGAGLFCSSRVVGPLLPEARKAAVFAGEAIGACAVAEPQSGTDPGMFQTRASRDGGGFRLTGTKAWVSQAEDATDFLVLAKLEEEGKFGLFHVTAGAQGVKVTPGETLMGLRGLNLGNLQLEGAQVAEAALLRQGELPQVLAEPLARQRVGLGILSRGIILACLEDSMAYAMKRENKGKKLAHQQLVHFKIAEMRTHHDSIEMISRRAAWALDKGDFSDPCHSVARIYGAECALECADKSLQLHGAHGAVSGHHAERRYRDARMLLLMGRPIEMERCDLGMKDLALAKNLM